MLRSDGRTPQQMRPVKFTPNYSMHAAGSVLAEFGDTKVLCTVCVDNNVPHFLRNASPAQGWLTAEYSMLPSATSTRSKRERGHTSGRTQEIQRLIGRSLRGAVDLKLCPDMTFSIDCDVLQADGGTRTTAITGAMVALKLAVNNLMREGKLKRNPITAHVAAVSVGVKDDAVLVDLNYIEDSSADLDMNVVMTSERSLLEIQGTAERAAFSKEQVMAIIESAELALEPVFEMQNGAAEGREIEG